MTLPRQSRLTASSPSSSSSSSSSWSPPQSSGFQQYTARRRNGERVYDSYQPVQVSTVGDTIVVEEYGIRDATSTRSEPYRKSLTVYDLQGNVKKKSFWDIEPRNNGSGDRIVKGRSTVYRGDEAIVTSRSDYAALELRRENPDAFRIQSNLEDSRAGRAYSGVSGGVAYSVSEPSTDGVSRVSYQDVVTINGRSMPVDSALASQIQGGGLVSSGSPQGSQGVASRPDYSMFAPLTGSSVERAFGINQPSSRVVSASSEPYGLFKAGSLSRTTVVENVSPSGSMLLFSDPGYTSYSFETKKTVPSKYTTAEGKVSTFIQEKTVYPYTPLSYAVRASDWSVGFLDSAVASTPDSKRNLKSFYRVSAGSAGILNAVVSAPVRNPIGTAATFGVGTVVGGTVQAARPWYVAALRATKGTQAGYALRGTGIGLKGVGTGLGGLYAGSVALSAESAPSPGEKGRVYGRGIADAYSFMGGAKVGAAGVGLYQGSSLTRQFAGKLVGERTRPLTDRALSTNVLVTPIKSVKGRLRLNRFSSGAEVGLVRSRPVLGEDVWTTSAELAKAPRDFVWNTNVKVSAQRLYPSARPSQKINVIDLTFTSSKSKTTDVGVFLRNRKIGVSEYSDLNDVALGRFSSYGKSKNNPFGKPVVGYNEEIFINRGKIENLYRTNSDTILYETLKHESIHADLHFKGDVRSYNNPVSNFFNEFKAYGNEANPNYKFTIESEFYGKPKFNTVTQEQRGLSSLSPPSVEFSYSNWGVTTADSIAVKAAPSARLFVGRSNLGGGLRERVSAESFTTFTPYESTGVRDLTVVKSRSWSGRFKIDRIAPGGSTLGYTPKLDYWPTVLAADNGLVVKQSFATGELGAFKSPLFVKKVVVPKSAESGGSYFGGGGGSQVLMTEQRVEPIVITITEEQPLSAPRQRSMSVLEPPKTVSGARSPGVGPVQRFSSVVLSKGVFASSQRGRSLVGGVGSLSGAGGARSSSFSASRSGVGSLSGVLSGVSVGQFSGQMAGVQTGVMTGVVSRTSQRTVTDTVFRPNPRGRGLSVLPPTVPPVIRSKRDGVGSSVFSFGSLFKRDKAYTPSAFALVSDIKGKPSKRAVVSGLGVRPITFKGFKL